MDLVCCTVVAIGIHLQSLHIDQTSWLKQESINDHNYGVYVELNKGAILGTYRNTLNRQSNYAGYNHHFGEVFGVIPTISFVGITGYNTFFIVPAIVPSIARHFGNSWYGRITYIPKTDVTGAHVVHGILEKRFNND